VVKVSGEAARPFLNGLLTADITKVTPEKPCFAALLTPQGKIIVDCIVVEAPTNEGGGFFLDCPRARAGELVGKLNFYRLRAKVIVEDLSETFGVLAIWDGDGALKFGTAYRDPRLPALGWRALLPADLAPGAVEKFGAELTGADAYDAFRIALGVPRGGADFAYGDAFPHETDMDQLNGVDFEKGCFVGQEVVSRVEHRGSARRRIVPVTTEAAALQAGAPVMAGEKQIGTVGSAAGRAGLAMLRIDYVADAQADGTPIVAGGVTLRPHKPEWATFAWPGEKAAE
jgi:folate-binding protein YgfZ